MDKKPRVVLLCAFSDQKLRSKLEFPKYYWANILRKLLHMSNEIDYAVWDSNAITEFEKYDDVEIHVVAPHSGISHMHEFVEKGIYYHIFWSEWDIIIEKIKRKLGLQNKNSFKHHRRIISRLVKQIKPDIIHVIGIENKFHSLAVLDLPKSIPVIAQLQTLVSDTRFKENTNATEKEYTYDSEIEKLILLRSNYIGTQVSRFRQIIKDEIKPDAVFLDTSLAVGETVDFGTTPKSYDFVYFAADISKAADWAIEAFAEALKMKPGITLDIVGGYSVQFKALLDNRIEELGIKENVTFEGKLPTHNDVLRQIRKARFALLPLKIDLVSGTIREAMACGLPVITTITPGTPNLNKKRECVLLSESGDHKAMANNMLKLLCDEDYAQLLRENAGITTSERISNKEVIIHWKESYYSCIENYSNKTGRNED